MSEIIEEFDALIERTPKIMFGTFPTGKDLKLFEYLKQNDLLAFGIGYTGYCVYWLKTDDDYQMAARTKEFESKAEQVSEYQIIHLI